MSIIAGRVSLNEKGEGQYSRPPDMPANEFQKLSRKDAHSSVRSGINVDPIVRKNILFVLLSMAPYLLVQIPAFFSGCSTGDGSKCDAHIIHWICLGCFVYCVIIMILYFVSQYKHSTENVVSQEMIKQEIKKSIQNGLVNISAVISNEIDMYCRTKGTESRRSLLEESPQLMDHVRILVRSFFYRYDQDRSGSMNVVELRDLLRDLGEPMKMSEVREVLETFDHDEDQQLNFDEFCYFIVHLVDLRTKGELKTVAVEEDDDEDEEEIPSDLVHLSPKQQQRRIILRSFGMMLAGTLVVILFSDPVVDVLDNMSSRLRIPNFYVSFILAPFISNASEILASFAYAKKKTVKSATISISTLQGSAVMNNTVCLGVFLILIFLRNLKWLFTAETITILFVEVCVMILSRKTTQRLGHAYFLLALYPFSIFLVWLMEHFGIN